MEAIKIHSVETLVLSHGCIWLSVWYRLILMPEKTSILLNCTVNWVGPQEAAADRHCTQEYRQLCKWIAACTQQSPFEKLSDPRIVKKFPTFYGTRKFIIAFHDSPPLIPVLSQPAHAPSCFFKIHFNIIPPSRPRSSKRYLSGFSTKTLQLFSPHTFHMSRSLYLWWWW